MIFQILPCQKNELTELRHISRNTFLVSYAHLNSEKSMREYIQTHFSEACTQKEFSNPNSFFFFLKKEDEYCGYTKLNIADAQTETRGNNTLEIERIYLKKEWQGQGLGRLLMEHSIKIAKEQSKNKIWLGVWEKNLKAIAFYEKSGFELSGKHKFVLGKEVQIDYLMEKKIL